MFVYIFLWDLKRFYEGFHGLHKTLFFTFHAEWGWEQFNNNEQHQILFHHTTIWVITWVTEVLFHHTTIWVITWVTEEVFINRIDIYTSQSGKNTIFQIIHKTITRKKYFYL